MTGHEMIEAIEQMGKVKGLASYFGAQLERRLKRPLCEEERAHLLELVTILGSNRVADVVLGLPADELAAWLADPNAR